MANPVLCKVFNWELSFCCAKCEQGQRDKNASWTAAHRGNFCWI